MNDKTVETKGPTAPRTFYSASGNLLIHMDPGKIVMQEGQVSRIGERFIQFRTFGADPHGQYTTSDPGEIDFLERRMLEQGDVFGPEEYARRTIPAEVRATQARQQLEEANREIGNLNRLLADLQAQGKVPPRPQAQK